MERVSYPTDGQRGLEQPIRTFYFIRVPNIGDKINPQIVQAVTHRPVHWTGDRLKPHLIPIGSLLSFSTDKSHIWGTGLLHPSLGVGNVLGSNIHALRGKLTHTEIQKAGLHIRDIPLGDPAVLAPRILGIRKSDHPRYRLGVIPHFADRRHPFISEISRHDDVLVLNVCDTPEAFFADLRQCQSIVSTSLHGLIFAESLGIASLWMELSGEVHGEGFKFHDWYSNSTNPQSLPFRPRTLEELAGASTRCEPRIPAIDTKELETAIPEHVREEIAVFSSDKTRRFSVQSCRTRPVPLFVISYNRPNYLRKVIASFHRQSRPCEVIVHDNGSDDSGTTALLRELELNGTKVYRHPKISQADELNSVNQTIQHFFENWAEPSHYVVTDCTIDLSATSPNALDVYTELLNLFRNAACVGPMLRIRDISRSYPLFNRVINRQVEQFWDREPKFVETSYGQVAYTEALFDTTFALHRAGEPFKRLKEGLRVHTPYEAQHLDWYHDHSNDLEYLRAAPSGISHWANLDNFERFKDEALRYSSFLAVETRRDGSLNVTSIPVHAVPSESPSVTMIKSPGRSLGRDPGGWNG